MAHEIQRKDASNRLDISKFKRMISGLQIKLDEA